MGKRNGQWREHSVEKHEKAAQKKSQETSYALYGNGAGWRIMERHAKRGLAAVLSY